MRATSKAEHLHLAFSCIHPDGADHLLDLFGSLLECAGELATGWLLRFVMPLSIGTEGRALNLTLFVRARPILREPLDLIHAHNYRTIWLASIR